MFYKDSQDKGMKFNECFPCSYRDRRENVKLNLENTWEIALKEVLEHKLWYTYNICNINERVKKNNK